MYNDDDNDNDDDDNLDNDDVLLIDKRIIIHGEISKRRPNTRTSTSHTTSN